MIACACACVRLCGGVLVGGVRVCVIVCVCMCVHVCVIMCVCVCEIMGGCGCDCVGVYPCSPDCHMLLLKVHNIKLWLQKTNALCFKKK